jgi:hypothetical protein
MAGAPFKVGRFAHKLRMRLMREHLGVDVDALDNEDLLKRKPQHDESDIKKWDPDREEGLNYGRDNVEATSSTMHAVNTIKEPLVSGLCLPSRLTYCIDHGKIP